MLHAKDLPLSLWAEAVSTAVYILNRTTTSEKRQSTPFEGWTGKRASLEHVRIFGSVCYMHINDQFRRKLNKKALKVLLVGYEGESANYRVYDPIRKTVKVSKNVIFDENASSGKDAQDDVIKIPTGGTEDCENKETVHVKPTGSDLDNTSQGDDVVGNESNEDEAQLRELRRRSQISAPDWYVANYAECQSPTTYCEAINSPEARGWKQAIDDELGAHEKNGTWEFTQRKTTSKDNRLQMGIQSVSR